MWINKKAFILIVSYMGVAILALGGYVLVNSDRQKNYTDTAKYGYEHAFEEVVTAVGDLDQTLRKSAYATGAAMTQSICSKVYGDSLAIAMTMSALPFTTNELEHTEGFVGKVGDYAYTLGTTAPAKGGFTDEERKNLAALSKTATELSGQLSKLQADVNNGNVIMDDPEDTIRTKSEEYKNSTTLSSVMLGYESAFPEQAKLQYDGKYTDRDKNTKQGEIVSANRAKTIAAEFLGLDEERLKLEYNSQGDVLYYYFSVSVNEGQADIVVTGNGKVKSFSSSRAVSSQSITADDAGKIAAKFLKSRGYENMVLSSSTQTAGVTRCEFVPEIGSVRYYPDRVKVAISNDNSGVWAFDASEYIEYHHDRTTPGGIVSKAQAQKAVPDTLSVSESRLAVILTEGENEQLCYEFKCADAQGKSCTIYADAKTGAQRVILLG